VFCRLVDRAIFYTKEQRASAYNLKKSWKCGLLHLSAPDIYATVLEQLQLLPGHSFLNIGSGTGYLNTMAGLLIGTFIHVSIQIITY
jgi:protein-L-isoaspartate O-methyltransferase